jgi:hypothetical protein
MYAIDPLMLAAARMHGVWGVTFIGAVLRQADPVFWLVGAHDL